MLVAAVVAATDAAEVVIAADAVDPVRAEAVVAAWLVLAAAVEAAREVAAALVLVTA